MNTERVPTPDERELKRYRDEMWALQADEVDLLPIEETIVKLLLGASVAVSTKPPPHRLDCPVPRDRPFASHVGRGKRLRLARRRWLEVAPMNPDRVRRLARDLDQTLVVRRMVTGTLCRLRGYAA